MKQRTAGSNNNVGSGTKKKGLAEYFFKKNLYFRDICVQSVLILSLKVDAQILILMNDHKTSKREIAHEHKSHDQPM